MLRWRREWHIIRGIHIVRTVRGGTTTELDLLNILDMSIGTLYLAYPEQAKGLRVRQFPCRQAW